jgi:hypothetical protein
VADGLVRNRTELLARLAVEEDAFLEEHIGADIEGDVSLEWDDDDAEFTVFVNGWGTTLTFPFTVGELWEVLHDLDEFAGQEPDAADEPNEENQQA